MSFEAFFMTLYDFRGFSRRWVELHRGVKLYIDSYSSRLRKKL